MKSYEALKKYFVDLSKILYAEPIGSSHDFMSLQYFPISSYRRGLRGKIFKRKPQFAFADIPL